MRICIILGPFIPTMFGGAVEKAHLALARAYVEAGHHVTIISRHWPGAQCRETTDGINHIRISSRDRSASLTMNLLRDCWYASRASRCSPVADVTITNSALLPLMVRRRKAGKIYVHVARFPKKQMSLYFRADRLQAVSRAVADAIVVQSPFLAGKVVSIGYPVPDRYFSVGTRVPRRQVVLYAGRIAREKGLALLLKAFAASIKTSPAMREQWQLRLVGPHEIKHGGDGAAYLEELKALAAALCINCSFPGPIFDQQRLAEEYQNAAVFVYPSVAVRGEAFGLAPLEAMAAGCAVVASSLRCFDDFVEDNVNGLRFDPFADEGEAALVELLSRLMRDPSLRNRLAIRGRQTADSFRTTAIAKRMLDDFASLN
jgi:glycosyltransferase involved in cell wall biosynthesis